jgi:hypothetical protein
MRQLHGWVIRPATAFGYYPVDILRGILNITGLTMHTVLSVNLKPFTPIRLFNDLIHPGRAIALSWLIIERQVVLNRDSRVL